MQNRSDITISDIQYEILLTQIRYLVKLVREYANEQDNDVQKSNLEAQFHTDSAPSRNLRHVHQNVRHLESNLTTGTQTEPIVSEVQSMSDPTVSELTQQMTEKKIASKSTQGEKKGDDSKASVMINAAENPLSIDQTTKVPSKSSSHYHLKLDDVPFLLGASSSGSHSIVANVQNIIAKMKHHNKALCAPRVQNHSNVASCSSIASKVETTTVNKMLLELSEDLTKLTQKQKRLETMIDNAQSNSTSKENVKDNLHQDPSKTSEMTKNAVSFSLHLKDNKIYVKKGQKEHLKSEPQHTVPSIRMQSNTNPQLARRTMLRSLKDFKRHLSAEDISWE